MLSLCSSTKSLRFLFSTSEKAPEPMKASSQGSVEGQLRNRNFFPHEQDGSHSDQSPHSAQNPEDVDPSEYKDVDSS